MLAFIRGAWFADRPANGLGVPRHARKLALAISPFRTGKYARRHFDEPRRELEDCEGRPRLSVARVEGALVQQFGHVVIRLVLDNHFGQVIDELRRRGGGLYLHLALPLDGNHAPSSRFALVEVFRAGPSRKSFSNPLNFLHGMSP